MLRSCGRALFRAVGEYWEAGGLRFDSAAGNTLLEPTLSFQRSLARKAFTNQETMVRAWMLVKSRGGAASGLIGMPYVCAEYILYVRGLAKVKGHRMAMLAIDRLWARVTEGDAWEQVRRV